MTYRISKLCKISMTGLVITLLSLGAGYSQNIRINHLGYGLHLPKTAVVEHTGELTGNFSLLDAQGNQVFSGPVGPGQQIAHWDTRFRHVLDFSEHTTAGTYTLRVGSTNSSSFPIAANHLIGPTLSDVLAFFYGSRANDQLVWNADQNVRKFNSNQSFDVRGGWYDASGDISKYLSHLHYANFMNPQQIPLTAWVLAETATRASQYLTAQGRLQDVREEALWGADYLVRVLDTAGYFYTNVFDNWTGVLANRRICAFENADGTMTNEFQAAWREGGGMSIAALARIAAWQLNSTYFTHEQYLAAAIRGFEHLSAQSGRYADDGRENIIDDYTALLAATELYITTNQPVYLTAARTRATNLVNRLHADGYFIADNGTRPFWSAADAGLPLVALDRYLQAETDGALRTAVLTTMHRHLGYLLSVTLEVTNPFGYARQTFRSQNLIQTGFFIPRDNETGYWWQGESARLGSLAAAAIITARHLEGSANEIHGAALPYRRYAINQLDWILGKNPYNVSFISGHGRNNPPDYVSLKPEIGHLDGGISNGITGANTNGSGISYNPAVAEPWMNWRWVEQWLPHSTWYLMALAVLHEDGIATDPANITNIRAKPKSGPDNQSLRIWQGSNRMEVRFSANLPGTPQARLLAVDGRQIPLQQQFTRQDQVLHLNLPEGVRGPHFLMVQGRSIPLFIKGL